MLNDGSNHIIKLINAEQLCWMPGSFDVAPRKVCALAFRVKGTADMLCAGKHLFIDAGDILYMPQGLGYQVDYTETEMYAIHFVMEQDDPEPEVYSLKNFSRVHHLFMQAASLWAEKSPGYENFCMAVFYEVLGLISQEHIEEKLPSHFKKALSYIHQHFTEPISIAGLCQKVHISPTAFRQYFRTRFGMSPTAYIRNLRLELARNMIAGGSSVEQTAQASGVGDAKYLARLVKQKYGCTPRQLKLHGK